MEVVKEGRIILHLETGKVDLKIPPGVSAMWAQQEAAIKRYEAEVQRLNDLYAQQARILGSMPGSSRMPGSPFGPTPSMPTSPPAPQPAPAPRSSGPSFGDQMGQGAWSSWQNGLAIMEKVDAEQRAIEKSANDMAKAQAAAAKEAVAAHARAAAATREAAEGFNMAAGGAMRMARAIAILGTVGDEDLQRLVKALAYVQAGFDLIAAPIQAILGVQKMLESLTKAETALAGAEAAETLAANANAAAHTRQAAAMGSATNAGGLLARVQALGSLGVAGGAAVVVLGTLAVALARESAEQERARQITEEHNRAIQTQNELARQASAQRLATAQSGFSSTAATFSSPESRLRQIKEEQAQIREMQAMVAFWDTGGPPTSERARVETEAQRLEIAQRIVQLAHDEQQAVADITAKKMEAYEAAKRQYDLESQKSMSLEARLGRLNPIEQSIIKSGRDKIMAKVAPDEHERQLFDRVGLSGMIDPFEAREARSVGLSAASFDGMEGSGIEMKAAAVKMKEAAQLAINEFKNANPLDAAELKKQRDELMKGAGDYSKTMKQMFESLINTSEELNKRVRMLEESVRNGI